MSIWRRLGLPPEPPDSAGEHKGRMKRSEDDSFDSILEAYAGSTDNERQQFHEQAEALLSLFGVEDKDIKKLRTVVEPPSRPKSSLSTKATALDVLLQEYERAIADHPNQAEILKTLYEEEKRKIIES